MKYEDIIDQLIKMVQSEDSNDIILGLGIIDENKHLFNDEDIKIFRCLSMGVYYDSSSNYKAIYLKIFNQFPKYTKPYSITNGLSWTKNWYNTYHTYESAKQLLNYVEFKKMNNK